MNKQNFFYRNKVLLIGLAGAMLLALQQFTGPEPVEWKGVAFALIVAGLGYLARNLRGQVATIIGIVLTVFLQYMEMEARNVINWQQLVIQLAVLLGGVFAPPAKSKGYEHTDVIQQAKNAGESIAPSPASPNPPTV